MDEKRQTIAGVYRGDPMTYAAADSGHINPFIGTAKGYGTNCQTVVAVFEARRRGYDVCALPKTPGSALDKLSRQTNLIWVDKQTGKHPDYITGNYRTAKGCLDWLHEEVKEDGHYTMQFAWRRTRYGYIVNIEKITQPDGSTKLTIKDNQRGKNEKSVWESDRDILHYLLEVSMAS